MAKKPAKSDRQAVIDQIRKKQKGADKRRNFAIVGVCVLFAALILGLAVYPIVKEKWDQRAFDNLSLEKIGGPASDCQKVTTVKADGSSQHEATGTQIQYTTQPPAFGPHWNELNIAPTPFSIKFYSRKSRPELEALVHNLEHGYTILWYDDTVADDNDTMTEIRAIADKFGGSSNNFRLKFKAVPWTAADAKETAANGGKPFPSGTHIAFTHWSAGGDGETDTSKQVGVFQYCSEPSGAALKAFMDEYPYTDSPEPDAG